VRGHKGATTLVLGASTYASPGNTLEQFKVDYANTYQSSWFAKLILEWLDGRWNNAYWTKLTEGFIGHSGSSMDLRRYVLESVAFYNYFDEILSTNKASIPKEAVQAAPEKYRRVISALQPAKVVVLSRKVRGYYFDDPRIRNASKDIYEHPLFGFPVRRCREAQHSYDALFLPHPSTSYWHNENCRAAIAQFFEDRGTLTQTTVS
jgi:hypothetical protein